MGKAKRNGECSVRYRIALLIGLLAAGICTWSRDKSSFVYVGAGIP